MAGVLTPLSDLLQVCRMQETRFGKKAEVSSKELQKGVHAAFQLIGNWMEMSIEQARILQEKYGELGSEDEYIDDDEEAGLFIPWELYHSIRALLHKIVILQSIERNIAIQSNELPQEEFIPKLRELCANQIEEFIEDAQVSFFGLESLVNDSSLDQIIREHQELINKTTSEEVEKLKVAKQQSAEQKTAEQQSAEQKTAEQQTVEQQTAEQQTVTETTGEKA